MVSKVIKAVREAVDAAAGRRPPLQRVDVVDPAEIREALGLSQAEFAVRYAIPYRTLQGWETGRPINSVSLNYLRTIRAMPQAVAEVIASGIQHTAE